MSVKRSNDSQHDTPRSLMKDVFVNARVSRADVGSASMLRSRSSVGRTARRPRWWVWSSRSMIDRIVGDSLYDLWDKFSVAGGNPA